MLAMPDPHKAIVERAAPRLGGFWRFPWNSSHSDPTGVEDPAHRVYASAQSPQEFAFESALEALNHTAQRIQYLWIAFIVAMLTFAITTANVSHRMLLLEEGVRLPFVDLTIPLAGYATIGPALFLVMHLYMLTMLIALARTAARFEDALKDLQVEDEKSERLRARLGNALFALLLSGPQRERKGALAALYTLIALTTVALAPIAVLLLFQLMFLPYQSDELTWWHRIAIVLDLVLVWTLWWSYRSHWGEKLRPSFRPVISSCLVALVSLTGLYGAFTSSFPCDGISMTGTEVVDLGNPILKHTATGLPVSDFKTCSSFGDRALRSLSRSADQFSIFVKRFTGDGPKTTSCCGLGQALSAINRHSAVEDYGPYRVFFGLFDNRLILQNQLLVDEDVVRRLREARESANRSSGSVTAPEEQQANGRDSAASRFARNFRGRRFRAADFSLSDLSYADFQSADLKAAQLGSIWLEGARLDGAQLQGSTLSNSRLNSASLEGSELEGADLSDAQLNGSDLSSAGLRRADLSRAILQGADLSRARLEETDLSNAILHGANLSKAVLAEANLNDVKLHGANLSGAKLMSARLAHAELQGADLFDANLDGANLTSATLHGARLDHASLRFANLRYAAIDGAYIAHMVMEGAIVRGGSAWKVSGQPYYKDSIIIEPPKLNDQPKWGYDTAGSELSTSAYVDSILAKIPNDSAKKRTRERLQGLLSEAQSQASLTTWSRIFVPDDKDTIDRWMKRTCDPANAPYGIRHLYDFEYEGVIVTGSRIPRRRLEPGTNPNAGRVWPYAANTFLFLNKSDRQEWVRVFRSAKAAPKDQAVACEAARQITDAQLKTLERLANVEDMNPASRFEPELVPIEKLAPTR